jgi:hypothetical protein
MGIVICMAVVFAVHSKCSYPQCSNFAQTPGGVCVQNGYKKKQCSKNGCTNKAVRKGVCKNHGAKQYCTEIDCGKALFWTGKCRHHFRFSLAASTIDMCPVGLHATIMDITDLTLEVIQQYVGMNNWENVIAFAGVCKSRSVSTKTYRVKIGVEPMEGGGGRKLSVTGFLSYVDQEKFRLAETVYVPCVYFPCTKSDKLLYCEVKTKCPRMRELIHSKRLMMTGITEFVEEDQSRHPCYRMYKHDHPNIDGVNAWVRWLWDRKHKLVMESQFVWGNTTLQ